MSDEYVVITVRQLADELGVSPSDVIAGYERMGFETPSVEPTGRYERVLRSREVKQSELLLSPRLADVIRAEWSSVHPPQPAKQEPPPSPASGR